jgi:drug/metabolite transporter (DMT)-like permease
MTNRNARLLAYVLLVATGLMFAANMLTGRATAHELPPASLAFWRWFGALLLMLPFVLLEPAIGKPYPLSWHSVGVAAFLALVPGFGAYQAYGYVQRHLGAGPTGLIMYMSPLFTGLLGYLLLGEALRLYHLVGALLVLPGIFLATRAERPK